MVESKITGASPACKMLSLKVSLSLFLSLACLGALPLAKRFSFFLFCLVILFSLIRSYLALRFSL